MEQIVAIATADQRKIHKKWYEIWKRDIVEMYEVENKSLFICFSKYTWEELQNMATEQVQTELLRIEKKIISHGFNKALITKKLHFALGARLNFENLQTYKGNSIINKIIPDILSKIVCEGKAKTYAFIEKDFQICKQLIPLVARHCKRLIIATEDNIEDYSENLCNEYGLLIEKYEMQSQINCDVAVVLNGKCYFPRETIVIDSKDTKKQRWLNFLQIIPPYAPLDFESLELLEAISD